MALRRSPAYPLIVLAAVATVVMTSACSTDIVERDGVVAFKHSADSGLQERAEGTLEVSEGGCLVLAIAGRRLLIAWPRDVQFRDAESGLGVVAMAREYRVGDMITLPGGEDPNAQETLESRAPDSCKELDGVYIVNTLG